MGETRDGWAYCVESWEESSWAGLPRLRRSSWCPRLRSMEWQAGWTLSNPQDTPRIACNIWWWLVTLLPSMARLCLASAFHRPSRCNRHWAAGFLSSCMQLPWASGTHASLRPLSQESKWRGAQFGMYTGAHLRVHIDGAGHSTHVAEATLVFSALHCVVSPSPSFD